MSLRQRSVGELSTGAPTDPGDVVWLCLPGESGLFTIYPHNLRNPNGPGRVSQLPYGEVVEVCGLEGADAKFNGTRGTVVPPLGFGGLPQGGAAPAVSRTPTSDALGAARAAEAPPQKASPQHRCSSEDLRLKLSAFYSKCLPGRVSSLVKQYEGREDELLQKLQSRYPWWNWEYMPQTASGVAPVAGSGLHSGLRKTLLIQSGVGSVDASQQLETILAAAGGTAERLDCSGVAASRQRAMAGLLWLCSAVGPSDDLLLVISAPSRAPAAHGASVGDSDWVSGADVVAAASALPPGCRLTVIADTGDHASIADSFPAALEWQPSGGGVAWRYLGPPVGVSADVVVVSAGREGVPLRNWTPPVGTLLQAFEKCAATCGPISKHGLVRLLASEPLLHDSGMAPRVSCGAEFDPSAAWVLSRTAAALRNADEDFTI
eukprot:TRINITY_DN7058_c0_g1_i1.p1 TRINITY_DN7058_c0_g1~~TRINITY_DN7058_c0_g1_i1.p1  ORF type:complete len:433 (+),score=25.11 TRINITY_DN7058_c0_g1_i1:38-1336(+)